MAYWLFKSEPSSWSWQDQIAKGDAGEGWDGDGQGAEICHQPCDAGDDKGRGVLARFRTHPPVTPICCAC